MDILIKNGFVVNAWRSQKADVSIKNGKIVSVHSGMSGCKDEKYDEVIDASGLLVMPGCIDAHVHFGLPYRDGAAVDDFETGGRAAISSGITTVIDYSTQDKGGSLIKSIESRLADAGKSNVDYSFHAVISDFNDKVVRELPRVIKNYGVTSFKLFMAYPKWIVDDETILNIMEKAAEYGAVVEVHAESMGAVNYYSSKFSSSDARKKYKMMALAYSRPCVAEAEAVSRLVFWSEMTGARLHIVHVSTAEAAYVIAEAKARGVNVTAETCPQYLLLTEDKYKGKNAHYHACCPPLREHHDVHGLEGAVGNGVIDMITTDSCAFTTRQKDMWENDYTKAAYGLYGIEILFPLMFNYLAGEKSETSYNNFVKLLSYMPAKIFGMADRKGHISAGADADIIIVDPSKKSKVSHKKMIVKLGYSSFEGLDMCSGLEYTIHKGKVAFAGKKFMKSTADGEFIKRK